MAAAVATPLPAEAPAKSADFDYARYQEKIKEYVVKAESFTLKPNPEVAGTIQHSGPQGKVVPLTIIDDPADWKASQWAGREEDYTYRFTSQDTEELLAAVAKLKARGIETEEDILALTKEDFELPTLASKLRELGKEVSQGKGFHLVRGFPVEQFKADRVGLVLAFWSLALHLGRPLVSQTDYKEDGTVFGSVLNHVTDGRWATVHKKAVVPPPPSRRTTGDDGKAVKFDKNRLSFHSDQGATDLIALLSIGKAKSGGVSKWVSSIAIHNELLRQGRKDLVEILSRPDTWKTALKHDQAAYRRKPDGSYEGFEEVIPFEYHNGYLTIHFEANKYQDIELTPLQEEALWAVASLAEDPRFHLALTLQPGDLEIIHNPSIFHARSEIHDGKANDEKRHLLRWWVHTYDNPRPIAPHFAPRSNVQEKGGFAVPEGSKLRLPLYPYSRHDGLGVSPASPVEAK